MSVALEKGEWVKGVAHWRDGNTAFLSVAFTWRLPEVCRGTDSSSSGFRAARL